MPFTIDGSRDDDATYYGLVGVTVDWRPIATCTTKMRESTIHPKVLAVMAESIHNHVYGYRYLEPEHLAAPWTPTLLLNIRWAQEMVSHYKRWADPGNLPKQWWVGPDPSDPSLPTGERIFQIVAHTFREAGLLDWVEWAETQHAAYQKRVAWSRVDASKWVPFQIDINSPPLFLTVSGPDDWQMVVDAVISDKSYEQKEFLQHMRMASVQYIKDELPGAHSDPTRKHDPGMPLGYGVSTKLPSFGYRREHCTDHLFVGWAAAVFGQNFDLFGPDFWPTKSS